MKPEAGGRPKRRPNAKTLLSLVEVATPSLPDEGNRLNRAYALLLTAAQRSRQQTDGKQRRASDHELEVDSGNPEPFPESVEESNDSQ